MTKLQIALIFIIPLLIVVLLTAVNRFWGWPTENIRLPIALTVPLLLVLFFGKKQAE
jgi:hypothetical protein